MTPNSARRLPRRGCALVIAALLASPPLHTQRLNAQPLHAQPLVLARPVGDTLRFTQSLQIDGISRGRAGNLAVKLQRDAKIAITFVTPDSATGWYDALTVVANGPGGQREGDTRAVVGAPFTLRVGADGAVATLRAPPMPSLMRDVAEFLPQFDDFFPRLPAAVAPGAARIDTLTDRQSDVPGRNLSMRRIMHSTVLRDTVIGRQRAHVLAIRTSLRIESAGNMGARPYAYQLRLDGTETGTAIVSSTGLLLHSDRTGEVRGSTAYSGDGVSLDVPQTYRYQFALRALDPPVAR